MTSPKELIDQARRGPVPADWRVFTKPRGVVGAFFRGTSGQPDPVLVITPEAAVEYASDKGCAVRVFWRRLQAGGYGPPGAPGGWAR